MPLVPNTDISVAAILTSGEDILNCSSEKDLERITTFANHAKIIEGPVAILCDFNLMKNDLWLDITY